ncbi:winged helix DNA-binding domain-containing protein [Devosia sp. XJ19-1]|uniref:Winged helix DNA-binding domain-containing protein n=1 Tax=Devosia ureilytica TaxID=2952754 RepID=A0A9Q4AMZ7_9HYPH|nr:crosslink repair DNA glycosylase YcaQ family protein [Devosia ureilytica]MCP8882997.1 winged helix DNA-binding domain-containing protein [Devosia ureilytica]MCP8886635.1 winged helix DNA-binding domain-containing protein [Devosia ureilytica]
MRAQRLDAVEPFGAGPEAAQAAIAQLGYVQIDTINVIERCHHHILYARIPAYKRSDLAALQSAQKSIFEYWTHALSYVPTGDLPYFLPAMKAYRENPSAWFGSVTRAEVSAMTRRLKTEGPLSIRDIDDDELVDKTHPWASRKPSKRVLQLMFYQGLVAIAAREGMVKTYDLIGRHFGWEQNPRPATERQVTTYLLDRALRSQGVVSLDSICHLNAPAKKAVRELIEARVKRRQLVPVSIEGAEKVPHWATPEALAIVAPVPANRVHILSPFDPLIIQRKRLKLLFGYDHIFEAYVPAAKRQYGYFALPVLLDDRVVAAVDLKTDRQAGKLLIQKWTWLEEVGAEAKAAIDVELGRFERFQRAL